MTKAPRAGPRFAHGDALKRTRTHSGYPGPGPQPGAGKVDPSRSCRNVQIVGSRTIWTDWTIWMLPRMPPRVAVLVAWRMVPSGT